MKLSHTEYAPKTKPIDYGYHLCGTCSLPFKAISKSNEKTRNHHLSDKFRAFEEAVAILTLNAFGRKKISVGWVIIEPYFSKRVHADLSNLPKSLLDGMVKGGVLKDDKNIAVTVLPAVYGKVDKIELKVWSYS